ncbi:MAG: glycosyltransferase family 2 protein [Anaerolineae bacterium]|nr:glycosyltransferase family 2 protein [Anaerolineae bacterium]MDQ7035024.1 glycosyltransferase family 2 protein [Anaerolineae bacterium]
MQYPKTLIILPALNEAGNINKAVTGIKANIPFADVLVINDGSTDSTAQEAHQAGATVINMPYNVGIGAAVQTGFKYAARHDYAVVIRNDGDGQHAADDIMRLLDTLLTNDDVDVVVGSRFLGDGDYGTSFMRKLGIGILSNLLTLITRQKITDPTSGFAAFNRQAILLFAKMYPHDYPEPEAVVLVHKSGLRQCEIPVTFHDREHGTSQFTAPTRSAYYMLKVTLAILINLLRRAPIIEQ